MKASHLPNFGRVDLLINNAGIFIAEPFAEAGYVNTPMHAKDDRAHHAPAGPLNEITKAHCLFRSQQ